MLKIAIVDKIHSDGIKLLEDNPKFQYEIIEDLSKKNLISKLPNFDGITLRRGKIDAEILEKCKNLKVISRHGVGYDNVDINFLKKNKIKLLVTGSTTSTSPAEHIMFMILNLSKGIDFFDKSVRNGNFKHVMQMKHKNFEIVVAPGPNEIEKAKEIDAISITNNDKSLNIMELAGLITKASYVIANDTGPAHMTAHLGMRGVVLFGYHTTAKKVSIETNKFKSITTANLSDLSASEVYSNISNSLK